MDRDIELLFEIGTIRHLDRVWKQFLNPDVANCAEHTFRVAWIAITISRIEGVGNQETILKMAMAHDLAESRTGDVHYLSRQYVERNESKAVDDIFGGTVHQDEMTSLLEDYEKRESIEAKIVKDADVIDVEMELAELKAKGHSLNNIWRKSRNENVYPKLYTKTAKKLWEAIPKTDPHNWHLLSEQNRFKNGDWQEK